MSDCGPAVRGIETFGACFDFWDESFGYLCGFVDDGRIDAEGLDHVNLSAGEYPVFDHPDHVSTISDTWTAILEEWMPSARVSSGEGPGFEDYAADVDPAKPGASRSVSRSSGSRRDQGVRSGNCQHSSTLAVAADAEGE